MGRYTAARAPWLLPAMAAVLSCIAAANANPASAFPSKSIRMVTLEPGGGTDFAARLIAQGLAAQFGQPVIVDNRGGANGIIAVQVVVKALPDGYTLLVNGSPVWLLPLLQDNVPYDPVRHLSPVALVTAAPNVLVVHPSSPANSVKELVALAKARPGALNYGSAATGGSPHLAAELFKSMAGVNIVRVPYKGAVLALNDVIGGQVQMMFPTAATVAPHLKSGKLKVLAVTTAQPSALLPGLPTVAASLPGYVSASVIGVFAPAATPAALVNRLNQEIVRVINRAEVKDKFFSSGVEIVGNTPAQFAAVMKSEIARMGKVIRDTGIRGE
jgi:tripartite-type tricarboxylate transporter receptor subunit TctC